MMSFMCYDHNDGFTYCCQMVMNNDTIVNVLCSISTDVNKTIILSKKTGLKLCPYIDKLIIDTRTKFCIYARRPFRLQIYIFIGNHIDPVTACVNYTKLTIKKTMFFKLSVICINLNGK